MKKVRIMWALWVLLMVPAIIFTTNPAIPIIAVLSILVPAVGIIFAAYSARGLAAIAQSAASVSKGSAILYSLEVTNSGRLSCARGKAVLVIENIFTGQSEEREYPFSVAGNKTRIITAEIPADNCGMVKVRLKALESHDLIGAYYKSSKAEELAQTLVMPETYHIEMNLGAGSQMDIDSDEYSQFKPGFDPSETFAIREYRAGDNLKNIHWKLSEKLDELTVRELGLPINNTVLVLMDTSYIEEKIGSPTPDIMDAIGETVVSVSQQLCSVQVPHQIGWYDRQNHKTILREVAKDDQLSEVMASLLAQSPGQDDISIIEHFIDEYGKPEYAHLVIISVREETLMGEKFCDGSVTNLVCSRLTGNTRTTDAGQVIYFTPETMTKDLLYLEV